MRRNQWFLGEKPMVFPCETSVPLIQGASPISHPSPTTLQSRINTRLLGRLVGEWEIILKNLHPLSPAFCRYANRQQENYGYHSRPRPQLAARDCQALRLGMRILNRASPERDAFERSVDESVHAYKVGEAIRQARLSKNLTLEQLVERMGVQKSQVCRLERGKSISFSSLARVWSKEVLHLSQILQPHEI